MQRSDDNIIAKSTHRKVKSSTTLNRRYVKRPSRKNTDIMVSTKPTAVVKRSSRVQHFQVSTPEQKKVTAPRQDRIKSAAKHPIQIKVNERMQQRVVGSVQAETKRLTAKELKDAAIRKALLATERTHMSENIVQEKNTKKMSKTHFGFGRVVLALSCAAVAVFAIVYFVNLNMPDISLKVAAMQTGIEASYPNYVPRDFSLSDITSEEGKITLNFRNSSTGDSFTLVEEESSWDSNTLLTNYVKDAYGENYATIKEQGLTLYISGSEACWVNGGVFFKLKTTSGSLTKKQIKSIATSL